MCSILRWILSIWEALGWIFCIFALIYALSTMGRSLSMFWATECIWKVFRWFRAISGLCVSPIWPVEVTSLIGQSVDPVHILRTGLTGGGDRSDQSELSWCSCSVFIKWFACIRLGGVALVQGELACVQGSSLWFSSFGLVVCALCLSIVLSQMCRVAALA
jgi:hypothetical protein